MGKSAVFPTMTISFNPLSTNSCGEPNMYMEPLKCRVTGATSRIPVATAQPPRWCEDNPIACVKGAKQMIFWNQASGNNIAVEGQDLSGRPKSPSYNKKLGFADGKFTMSGLMQISSR